MIVEIVGYRYEILRFKSLFGSVWINVEMFTALSTG